ncbi:MAG: hypothetical protein AVDCRST_MAG45-683 [uncultured Solirubrobacterales bacterium]|uniref:Uncharacterized protein n=1 Tax=uncultured Solirubrobacterales bacterium TaxID=768556 RepID=A0A6J4SER2_9ACTN|nr:MAG: hypothetical protein AVDCRST_MAG45-683 [uncultured Solirubrobacterales bacterium]
MLVAVSLLGAVPAFAGGSGPPSPDQYEGGAGPPQSEGPEPGDDPYSGGVEPQPEPDTPPSERPSSGGSGPAAKSEPRGATKSEPSGAERFEGRSAGGTCGDGGGDQGSATPLEDAGNVASVALARTGLDAWLLPMLAGASIGAAAVIAVQRRGRPSN